MRLTGQLLKWGKIPGKINQGKHQVPHYYNEKTRARFVQNLRTELENEMWLTRPYLTAEAEQRLPNGTRFTSPYLNWSERDEKVPQEELYEYHNKRYRLNMLPHVTLEERWFPIERGDRWEDIQPGDKPVNRFKKFSEMAKVKRLPERWPRPEEKWDEWEEVQGIRPNPESKKED